MIAVVVDVGRQQQRVAAADDALLAEVGRAPIDFQRELVGLDDLRRLGKSLANLRQECQVAVRGRLIIHERRVGQLGRSACGCALDEATRSRIVPRLSRRRARRESESPCIYHRRGEKRRENSKHDFRISPAPERATSAARCTLPQHHRIRRHASMSFDRFCDLAVGGGLVPVWRELLLDTDTPVSAFAKLRRGPFAFLLESAPAGGETWARYTFLGTEPRAAWRLRDGVVEDWTQASGWRGARRPSDPLADLRTLLRAHEPVELPELGAFWCGAVGYFAYD